LISRTSSRLAPAIVAGALAAACGGPQPGTPPAPGAEGAAAHAVSPPVMLLRDAPAGPRWQRPVRSIPRRGAAVQAPARAAAPALVAEPLPAPAVAVPAPIGTFEGIGDAFRGLAGTFSVNSAPPDTVGDVGPSHYVQMVNAAFGVFDKSGTVLAGPTATNALFGALGATHKCFTTNQGDGIVLYDPLADRWFLSQFAFDVDASGNPIAPFFQCVALSRTNDPTGQYDLWALGPFKFNGADALNDYPKFGVWPDAYYFTANMFTAGATSNFLGANVCGLDRAKMLAGTAAAPQMMQCFELPGFGGLLPADLDGKRAPPGGSPGYVLSFDNPATGSVLQFWRVKLDWVNTANSALLPGPGTPTTLPVSPIVLGCGSATNDTCVRQPGTATQLDAVGDRFMHRLAYRNFGDHESLVVTHTVQTGAPARAAPRWYELRNSPGQTLATANPVLAQTGTHSPDATFRWMGSAAQDQLGDLALGYSASNAAALHPSLFYVGRSWNEPVAGAMSFTEGALFTGLGSQTTFVPRGSTTPQPLSRWGDYSALTVDPSDDCTFWYTNQYQAADGAFNWHTRVGRFKLPTCPPQYAVSVPATMTAGVAAPVTITAQDALGATWASYAGPATLSSDDPGATFSPGPSVAFASGVATVQVKFSTAGTHTLTIADPFSPNLRRTVNEPVTPSSGVVVRFSITTGATGTAGVAQAFTATAVDGLDAPVASYAGTATLTSSTDAGATFSPTTLAFSGGTATGSVTLRKAGTQTFAVADSVTPALTGTASVAVAPAAVDTLSIAGLPASIAAGTPAGVTVTARDAFGNLGAGTAALTSSDPAALLSTTTLSFAAAPAGATVTFQTAGAQSLTVQSGGVSATATTTVTAATPTPTPTPTPTTAPEPTPTPTPQPTESVASSKGGGCASSGGGFDAWLALGLALALAPLRAWGTRARGRRAGTAALGPALAAAGALAASACAGSSRHSPDAADAARGAEVQPAEHAVSPPVNALPDAAAPPRADHRPGPIRHGEPDAGAADAGAADAGAADAGAADAG
jgi:hypothetical protein